LRAPAPATGGRVRPADGGGEFVAAAEFDGLFVVDVGV